MKAEEATRTSEALKPPHQHSHSTLVARMSEFGLHAFRHG
jgi:hypothetical protein